MFRMTATKLIAATAMALVCLLGLGASPASASSITFNLTFGNSAISGFPQPYASVLVDLTTSTTATITFTALNTDSNHAYLLGDGGTVAVNVNGPFSLTLPNASLGDASYLTGFGPATYSGGGSGNVNGFGSFNLVIDSTDGFTDAATSIKFSIQLTSGTWATASDVLIANSTNAWAAGHIFVCNNPLASCATTSGAINTGFASGNFTGQPLEEVPEPGTLFLLGTGLLGTAMLARRRLARR